MAARLLLVEDHAGARTGLKKILKEKGYDVLGVESGAAAVRLASELRFDLVIMDHGLPDGNGCSFMRLLNRVYGIIGIALTGNAFGSDKLLSEEAGFRAHLTKPVNVDVLCRAIKQHLPVKARDDSPGGNASRLCDRSVRLGND